MILWYLVINRREQLLYAVIFEDKRNKNLKRDCILNTKLLSFSNITLSTRIYEQGVLVV